MALTVTQVATVINDIMQQATGQKVLTGIDTKDFISVANTVTQTGFDPVLNSISQILSRTIFSVRPYDAKFKSLQVDNVRYGNHVRKLQVIDQDFVENDEFKTVDGSSIDMYKVRKPKVLQTNFYDQRTYGDYITIYRDQLNTAFNGPDEFARFLSMVTQNISDKIEQKHEGVARFINANLMAGAKKVKLIEAYNTSHGTSLTYADILKKENFTDFWQYCYAVMRNYSNLMTERTIEYHTNITNKPIMRHTPYRYQKMYTNSFYDELVKSTVLSAVYHDEYLKKLDFETVNYWQAFKDPLGIKGKWTHLKADGTLEQTAADTAIDKIFGIIFDEEAQGYTIVNHWTSPTPFNAAGGYTNLWYHFTDRFWNDFTENAIVFTLEA